MQHNGMLVAGFRFHMADKFTGMVPHFGIGNKALETFLHLRKELIRENDRIHANVDKVHHRFTHRIELYDFLDCYLEFLGHLAFLIALVTEKSLHKNAVVFRNVVAEVFPSILLEEEFHIAMEITDHAHANRVSTLGFDGLHLYNDAANDN